MVWAWSVLQTRKWASHVEFVTDKFGAELFDELGIEFDSVNLALDDIEPHGMKLWAIGKLRAYELQNEPFMHLDGDAWFETPPSAELLNHRVACQSKENTGVIPAYVQPVRQLLRETDDVHPYRLFHAIGPRDSIAGCLSVYVCNDLEFNREYCQLAREFYDTYLGPRPGDLWTFREWNIVVEQLIFGELHYQKYGVEPTYLLSHSELLAKTNVHDFCHVWNAKRSTAKFHAVERLRLESSETYKRIAERFGFQAQT